MFSLVEFFIQIRLKKTNTTLMGQTKTKSILYTISILYYNLISLYSRPSLQFL